VSGRNAMLHMKETAYLVRIDTLLTDQSQNFVIPLDRLVKVEKREDLEVTPPR